MRIGVGRARTVTEEGGTTYKKHTEEKNRTRKETKSSSGSNRVNSRVLKVVPMFDTETMAKGQ